MTANGEARVRLTKAQRAMLYALSRASRLVSYDNTEAVALIRMGFAERTVAFEKLRITPAGRRALENSHDK